MRLACLAHLFLVEFTSNGEKEGKGTGLPGRLSMLPFHSLARLDHQRSDPVREKGRKEEEVVRGFAFEGKKEEGRI